MIEVEKVDLVCSVRVWRSLTNVMFINLPSFILIFIFSDIYSLRKIMASNIEKAKDVNLGSRSKGRAPINISIWGSSHVKFPGFGRKVREEFEKLERSFPGKFKLGKVFGKSGAEWGRHRDSDLLEAIKEYAFKICRKDDYNGQIVIIVLGSNDTRRINPNGLSCVTPYEEEKFGNLGESFDMFSFTKMKRRVEDLVTVLSGCSGVGVVLCNSVLVYNTQLSFVNSLFQDMAKKHSNTKWCQVKMKQFEYFRPDGIHLNETGLEHLVKCLFDKCKFMPMKVILNDKK